MMASLFRAVFRAMFPLKSGRLDVVEELQHRFLPSPWGDEVRVSRIVARFGVTGYSDLCKSKTATTTAPGCWPLGTRARRFLG